MDQLKHTLVIDAGNTLTKAAIFENGQLIAKAEIHQFNQLETLLHDYDVTHALLGSVGGEKHDWVAFLKSRMRMITLSSKTPLPIVNLYETPDTLGVDRIAGAVGATHFFKDKNCLVIDTGTCITYDFIDSKKQYHGGAISPGLMMRLRAMHHYTHKLPLVPFHGEPGLIGKTTEQSLLSGAFFGMAGEINGQIEQYMNIFGEVQVILCGGDAQIFGKHIKNNIFAAPDLVLFGLNKILLFNVEKGL